MSKIWIIKPDQQGVLNLSSKKRFVVNRLILDLDTELFVLADMDLIIYISINYVFFNGAIIKIPNIAGR
jgi:hypothetical protein